MATPIYNASLFAQYFSNTDPAVIAFSENILEKLYAQGIVPKYITRQENTTVANAPAADADYINFWRPITLFWAYAVELSRTFENFTGNRNLLREHLLQRGYYPNNDQTLDKLIYMMEKALKIRAQRGTIEMYQIGDTGDSDSDSGAYSDGYDSDSDAGLPYIDGELLKLIQYRKNDFFQLGNPLPKYAAWNIGHYSPLYMGLTGRYDLNLGYEWTEDVISLTPYPLINQAGCSIVTDTTDDDSDSTPGDHSISHSWYDFDVPRQSLQLDSTTTLTGIGKADLTKALIIDPQLNFEITFQVRQLSLTNNFTFGCLCFDQQNNPISLLSVVTGSNQQNFFTDQKLNRSDKFYFVRGIIYNSNQSLLSSTDAKLNIGFGNNLKFPSNAKKIIPYIIADKTASSTILHIWNLKINVCSLTYNNVYTTGYRHIDIFLKNNNPSYDRNHLYTILRKYFLPYNSSFSITHLGL